MPIPVLVGLVVWLTLFYTTGYVAVASMGAGISLPIAEGLRGVIVGKLNWIYLAMAVLAALMAVLRHRSNIRRLREGTEHRFGNKGTKTQDDHED